MQYIRPIPLALLMFLLFVCVLVDITVLTIVGVEGMHLALCLYCIALIAQRLTWIEIIGLHTGCILSFFPVWNAVFILIGLAPLVPIASCLRKGFYCSVMQPILLLFLGLSSLTLLTMWQGQLSVALCTKSSLMTNLIGIVFLYVLVLRGRQGNRS